MITAILPLRDTDSHGSGAYGAPRGSRTHKGLDYAVPPGALILAPVTGTVTKLGYPYADDHSFRYVEVTDLGGTQYRYFYVQPLAYVGAVVRASLDLIGFAQDLTSRYPGITNHIHFEAKRGREYLDPRLDQQPR